MNVFGFRSFILIFILALWVLAALGHIFYFAVLERDKYIELGRKIAWRKGVYPAVRGKILDKNKVALAWSEKYFDLVVTREPEGGRREEIMYKELSEMLGKITISKKDDLIVLKSNLSPENILMVQKLIKNYPELSIVPRFERRCIDYPEVKAYIGKVAWKDGSMIGVTGVEQKFNDILSGSDGEYSVMVNKHEEWISGTWQLITDSVPGRNVYLDKSIDEIRAAYQGGRRK